MRHHVTRETSWKIKKETEDVFIAVLKETKEKKVFIK